MKGKLTLNIERMEDTCSPGRHTTLQSLRIYSILIPCLTAVLFFEAIYIIASIPGTLGSGLTIKGPLPQLNIKKL